MDEQKEREEIIKKWKESGVLDGIKGPINDDIAKLYESQATVLITEKDDKEDFN